MTDDIEYPEEEAVLETEGLGETSESKAPTGERKRMPPVESRFMFVDIAALRTKQLRRGVVPRITLPTPDGNSDDVGFPWKLERIAMREVEEGLIAYEIPGVITEPVSVTEDES